MAAKEVKFSTDARTRMLKGVTILAEDEVLLAVDLDVRARVLAEEHAIARLDVHGDLGAVLEDLAVSDGDDLALLGLLLGGVRDDDPALHRLLLFDPSDDQPIM